MEEVDALGRRVEAFVDEDADGVFLGVADAAHADLVAESFGRDDGDLLEDAVGVEVEGELGVVLLDDDPGSLSIFSLSSPSRNEGSRSEQGLRPTPCEIRLPHYRSLKSPTSRTFPILASK